MTVCALFQNTNTCVFLFFSLVYRFSRENTQNEFYVCTIKKILNNKRSSIWICKKKKQPTPCQWQGTKMFEMNNQNTIQFSAFRFGHMCECRISLSFSFSHTLRFHCTIAEFIFFSFQFDFFFHLLLNTTRQKCKRKKNNSSARLSIASRWMNISCRRQRIRRRVWHFLRWIP